MRVTSTGKVITKYPYLHDPGDKKFYTFIWKSPIWQADTLYLQDETIQPSTANGFEYICFSPGVTDTDEPVWPTGTVSKITDGGVIWAAKSYESNLLPSESITSSIWKADTGISITSDSQIEGVTFCKVEISDLTLTSFTLTNQVEILREGGKNETLERSVVVTIGKL